MVVNYVFFRKIHFLPLMFMIKAHYSDLKQSVRFVIRSNVKKALRELALLDQLDCVSTGDLHSCLASEAGKLTNIILHHSRIGVDDARAGILPALGQQYSAVSFFADGFTNQLDDPPDIVDFLTANPNLSPGALLYFDKFVASPPQHVSSFRPAVVRSSGLQKFAFAGRLGEISEQAYSRCSELAAESDILVVMPRDWSGNPGRRGQLFVGDPAVKTAELVLRTAQVVSAHMGSTPLVIVRPDGRSPTLMAKVFDRLSSSSSADFINADAFWPPDVNFDPFLLRLLNGKVESRRAVSIASFDSTAPLPFVGLGCPGRYFLGAPQSVVGLVADTNDAQERFVTKIARLVSHVEELSYKANIQIERIDDLFFMVDIAA